MSQPKIWEKCKEDCYETLNKNVHIVSNFLIPNGGFNYAQGHTPVTLFGVVDAAKEIFKEAKEEFEKALILIKSISDGKHFPIKYYRAFDACQVKFR